MRAEILRPLVRAPERATVLVAPVAVPAGYPSPSQDYYDGPVDLNTHLIKDPPSTFIVRVSGNSMLGAQISDGDELIVSRAITPQDMSVVVAILDGELTVKRLRLVRGGVVLQSENSEYPDIRVGDLSELDIWGVVTKCIHTV